MKRSLATVATGGMLFSALLVAAPVANAGERVCRGTIGAVSLDNVVVPQGASCTLSGTSLKGTLKVERGATATVTNARINGNIQSQEHRTVRVSGTRVGGSIQLEKGGAITLRSNTVNGDVQLFTNPTGTKSVVSNTIGGNLQCKENVPAPTGTNNRVGGNAEDQCRRLAGGTGATTQTQTSISATTTTADRTSGFGS